jgi:hypothetical protein
MIPAELFAFLIFINLFSVLGGIMVRMMLSTGYYFALKYFSAYLSLEYWKV